MSRDSGMTERAVRATGDILDVATAEFAANGYAGARVDEIAARTRTTKRMIYYYFGSKEGLYLAVLERVYAQIRRVERGIRIDELSPDEALRKIAEATYDHHTTHEAFIQLVSIENIHRAEHLRQSETILRENVTAITLLEEVIERGVRDGIFRDDVDAIDVHMVISAYACFHVANRHTFAAIFDRDMLAPGAAGLAPTAHRRHDRRDDDGSPRRRATAAEASVRSRAIRAGRESSRERERSGADGRRRRAPGRTRPRAPTPRSPPTSTPEGEKTGLATAAARRRRTLRPPPRGRSAGYRRAHASDAPDR